MFNGSDFNLIDIAFALLFMCIAPQHALRNDRCAPLRDLYSRDDYFLPAPGGGLLQQAARWLRFSRIL